ncbi:fibrinogen-like protein 1 [Drosophila ficusphila]|uniref:fibrinogen-like protein 1 n=1 Tax=Drosophila ficusphila TaxID=30025 RepID=UPI001C89C696|nr:fibrinogen-like protein 1 [Drosophila ficusphila]
MAEEEEEEPNLNKQTSDDNLFFAIYTCPSFNQSSIYKIKIPGSEPFTVPCELTFTGWTVIQRRVDGSENFARNWTDYKNGFGDLSREFFIGLQKLHLMTSARPHELYIKLGKIDGSTSFAHYDDFKIGSEAESFKLISVGKYSGTAGDSLKSRESYKFSTFDRENDRSRDSCAVTHGGGWWYYACTYSMLNGKYYKDGRVESGKTYGIHWGSWQNDDWTISLTFAEMMIRPKA